MKRTLLRLVALAVIFCLLLGGCVPAGGGTAFRDMVYTRPDLPALLNMAQKCMEQAQTETDVKALVSELEEFTIAYSDFYTQYLLSYVHYCLDMEDLYWVEEYRYCEERTAQAEAARDQLMYALAECSLREELEAEDYFGEGFFDDYQGESIWTEEFKALMEQEAGLVTRYYSLLEEQDLTGLESLYIQLVALRQQIAREAGFDSYPEFAYEHTYYRDYSMTQAISLCRDIYQELVPLYRLMAQSGFWGQGIWESSTYETYRYVRTAARNMGGTAEEAFRVMDRYELYHLYPGENKFDNTFEVYFYNYDQPFVFLSPTGSELDQLSFAHEFGHFCNDYATYGSAAGLDCSEVFSQGMEYMSLFYGNPSDELVRQKLADTLCVYVEQAAYSCFEQQVYELSREDLTVEKVRELYQKTGEAFGFDYWDFDPCGYVQVAHFFIQPLYVISYVVSNDAAFQLYQMEDANPGSGLEVYLDSLDTEQTDFLPFLEETGLESPFLEGRIHEVKETLQLSLCLF